MPATRHLRRSYFIVVWKVQTVGPFLLARSGAAGSLGCVSFGVVQQNAVGGAPPQAVKDVAYFASPTAVGHNAASSSSIAPKGSSRTESVPPRVTTRR